MVLEPTSQFFTALPMLRAVSARLSLKPCATAVFLANTISATRSPGRKWSSASRASIEISSIYFCMLPLTSSSRISVTGSSPCANETMDCGWPSSVTAKSVLARSLISLSPSVTWTSTRTSDTPVLNVGVASSGCSMEAGASLAFTGAGSWAPRGVRKRSVEKKNIIIGTAGHIDHGKTALVRVLTGIDTDRLKEEKQRGISIDLGFAHLQLSENVRLGLVDVPGHERFIKNMLAGVSGIDLVLFVIAADESIKPQTREHFDICMLLGIQKGLVVLTKADLATGDLLELARLEAAEFVRGSFLEDAPMVAVSATTGAGLDELRAELAKLAAAVPQKDASQYFRLPIDRAFAMRGFGTVVTGTLVSGTVRVDQDVELHPARKHVRVRGIQVHGAAAESALAGQRTALNIAGIEVSELARGMVLAEAGRFQATSRIDCAFQLLPSAKPLKHRAPVHFHAGAAVVEAEIRRLSGTGPVAPGSREYVRLLLREPLLLLPGDRFIVRKFSPVVTIGGGVVLDISPPRRAHLDRLRVLETGPLAERIALLARESRYGIGMADLVARTGLLESDLRRAAADSASQTSTPVIVLESPQFWLLDRAWVRNQLEVLHQYLTQ